MEKQQNPDIERKRTWLNRYGKALPNSAVLLNSWKKPATALRPSA